MLSYLEMLNGFYISQYKAFLLLLFISHKYLPKLDYNY